MSEIILHHYPGSLYSEKIRLVLGLKGLAWRSVVIPMVMPKPDLLPLTGGYRRTPVMQIGNDVYCDTLLIAETLERIAPRPSMYAPGQRAVTDIVAQWGDTYLFWAAMGCFYKGEGVNQALSGMPADQAEAYVKDRADLLAPKPVSSYAESHATLRIYLARLQQMLEHGNPFLLGESASLADISCYHPLWILRKLPATAPILKTAPLVAGWMDRVKAIGHGQRSDLSALDALAIAKNHPHAEIASGGACDISGLALGDSVRIMPSDYGLGPVEGELVLVEDNHMAIRRVDDRAGTVIVHFPRTGYQVTAIN